MYNIAGWSPELERQVRSVVVYFSEWTFEIVSDVLNTLFLEKIVNLNVKMFVCEKMSNLKKLCYSYMN